ncbi:MAG: UDP-3-O-(3-hydroxymyristoyl)glucosamine N-acyltransferase [Gemmatimonadetes bacterium]|nr:UDP-3-O-(3-hydroxymyristoyl)glucosamine N-acyltransferase [Gemmatimonadota bacterium]
MMGDRTPATPGLTLGDVADLVDGRLIGDPSCAVRGVAPLAHAGPDQIAPVVSARYRSEIPSSRAGCLLVAAALADGIDDPRPRVVVADPHAALIPLLTRLHPETAAPAFVHPTAVIGAGVVLGADVGIGPLAVVGDGCRIGDRSRIGAHVVIGAGCQIGADSVVHPHVTLYPAAILGARVILHSGVRIGADGFGYAFADGGHRKIPHVGGCVIEDDVEIGANSTIDRGSIGDTVIGRGSKLDNLVHVGHNVRIGPHCILTGMVGISGSTTIGAGVQFGGQSGAAGHLTIGDGARVGAKSAVLKDVPAGASVIGIPAAEHGAMKRAFALFPRLPELFQRLRTLEGTRPPGETDGD